MSVFSLDRIQFAFTIIFHYLFPQLTMGLALLIVILKGVALRTGNERYNQAARFWAKLFAINFVFGVVTGIPMEFQFGTNWARFSRTTGGVIGQPLAMEGIFSFFLESTFLGLFLFAEKRLSKIGHFVTAVLVFLGSWISAFFIIVADAWMQHPVAYQILPNGTYQVRSFWGLMANPWAWREYTHTMSGSVITASFVIAATGAFYLINRRDVTFGKLFVRAGVIAGVIACCIQLFPTGDSQARYVSQKQPVTLAAMEGLLHTRKGASMTLIGQPNMTKMKMDNPIQADDVLSLLIYGSPRAQVNGLTHFPRKDWPTSVPLVYYSYHIMVGLGTYFVGIMVLSAFLLWRRKLYQCRLVLWALMLSFPLPYIANTAGWMTAETGRQPWLVYGLMRTSQGYSAQVSTSNTLFTLMGFFGVYAVLSILWLVIVYRFIQKGPAESLEPHKPRAVSA